MARSIRTFVSGIVFASVLATSALFIWHPDVTAAEMQAAAVFVLIGIVAQALRYHLARGATGSISFIPFLAMTVLSPNWLAVVGVLLPVAVSELTAKRPRIKVAFNLGQYVLAMGAAVAAFRLGAGISFLSVQRINIVALVLAFLAFTTVNSWSVSAAIGITERKSVVAVWRENTLSGLVYDILSLPFVYAFAYAYVSWGPGGAFLLAIPLLGVRQLYKNNWELQKTNAELLELMVAAIEARDPYTSGHSRRVAHYASLVCRAMGMSNKQSQRVTIAALLHDVGKIGEEFAPILRKPGKLTEDERRLMETHSIKSADLVSRVSYLTDIVPSVRHHHENWDGTGYPDRLSGEEIPLGARVIMFADTIDAMTSDRPYRAALSPDDVRSELIRMRGSQFDPVICDALLRSTVFADLFRRSQLTPIQSYARRSAPALVS